MEKNQHIRRKNYKIKWKNWTKNSKKIKQYCNNINELDNIVPMLQYCYNIGQIEPNQSDSNSKIIKYNLEPYR